MIRRYLLGAIVLLSAWSHAPAFALECDVLKAVYTPLDNEDDMSAEAGKQNRYSAQHIEKRLRFNQARFAFRIMETNQKLSYDFGFAFSNGYGRTSLVFAGPDVAGEDYKRDPDDPTSFIMYFDEGLKQTQPDWEKGGKAPHYLIMPGIGSSFWYWKSERNFVPPAGMWKLSSCKN